MSCERFIDAVLESVGTAPPAPEVQAHLNGCAACRALAARTAGALALLDGLPDAPVPPGFAPRTLARAKAEQRGRRSVWVAAAAAAALVVTGGWLAATLGPGAPGDGRGGVDVANHPGATAAPLDPAAPPAELIDNLELFENLDLLQKLEVMEALDAVEARERYKAID